MQLGREGSPLPLWQWDEKLTFSCVEKQTGEELCSIPQSQGSQEDPAQAPHEVPPRVCPKSQQLPRAIGVQQRRATGWLREELGLMYSFPAHPGHADTWFVTGWENLPTQSALHLLLLITRKDAMGPKICQNIQECPRKTGSQGGCRVRDVFFPLNLEI